jgi:phosphoribosylformylglycinamidine synthase
VQNPDGPRKLGALVRACQGLYDFAVAYGTPFISGKDSVKNDFVGWDDGTTVGIARAELGAGAPPGTLKLSIPPTLLVSAIGVLPDHRDAVTMDFKLAGDRVYVVGLTRDERGASEWARLSGEIGGELPSVDPALARRCYGALHRAIREGLVTACHDVSDGGLGVALAECAMAGELGLDCDLGLAPGCAALPPDGALFSESAGRLVVTVAPADCERFEILMEGLPTAPVGHVTAARAVVMAVHATPLVRATVAQLKRAWQETPQW